MRVVTVVTAIAIAIFVACAPSSTTSGPCQAGDRNEAPCSCSGGASGGSQACICEGHECQWSDCYPGCGDNFPNDAGRYDVAKPVCAPCANYWLTARDPDDAGACPIGTWKETLSTSCICCMPLVYPDAQDDGATDASQDAAQD